MKKKLIAILLIFYIIFLNTYICFAVEGDEEIDQSDPLGLLSEGAVLLEMETGKVLYDKNMNERLYPASITKILTAILVLENCNDLSEKTVASEYAVNSIPNGYTTAGIKVGEAFSIEELLEVMLLRSANEAATILAEYVSGSLKEFCKLMNEKAKSIGAVNSNFLNANGMHDENHYSTAYDMALIEKYCMQNKEFRRISKLTSCSLPNTPYYEGETRFFKNTHAFLLKDSSNYYKYAIAGKTGYTTPAKNCLVTCANKDGFELVAVVLHAEGSENGVSARYLDTKKLLDFGYDKYEVLKVRDAGETIEKLEIKTRNGEKKKIDLILEDGISIISAKNEDIIEKKGDIELKEITLPIRENQILGNITYTINGEVYNVNVLAGSSVDFEEGVSKVIFETDKKAEMLVVAIILGLAFVSVVVVIIFIIVTIRERREKFKFS